MYQLNNGALTYVHSSSGNQSAIDLTICNPAVDIDSTRKIHDTIYPTPPLGQDMTQGQFLSGV